MSRERTPSSGGQAEAVQFGPSYMPSGPARPCNSPFAARGLITNRVWAEALSTCRRRCGQYVKMPYQCYWVRRVRLWGLHHRSRRRAPTPNPPGAGITFTEVCAAWLGALGTGLTLISRCFVAAQTAKSRVIPWLVKLGQSRRRGLVQFSGHRPINHVL
jgi:hypothetical protein